MLDSCWRALRHAVVWRAVNPAAVVPAVPAPRSCHAFARGTRSVRLRAIGTKEVVLFVFLNLFARPART
jgi:hypothetical protein